MRWIRTAAPLFVLGLIACEGEQVSSVRGDLDAPEVVDFGDVQIGIIQPMTIDVKNVGSAVVTVDQIEQTNFTGSNFEFRLSESRNSKLEPVKLVCSICSTLTTAEPTFFTSIVMG